MKTILLGANNPHNGRMMRDISAASTPMLFEGWLDDNVTGEFCGLPILGGMDRIPEFVAQGYAFVNTVSGSTIGRFNVARRVVDAGGFLADFVHPSARSFEWGEGIYCQDEVGVQANVDVGDNVAIHARAFLSHDVRVGNSCFVGAGVLAGRVTMEDGSYLGINATVLPDLTIGRWSIIGAGAVVTKSVPPYSVVVGSPARVIREAPVYDATTGELLVSGAIR